MLNVSNQYVGGTFPLHASATGKLILAELDDARIEELSDCTELRELTLDGLNKVGGSSDIFSPNTPLVGSLVPAP